MQGLDVFLIVFLTWVLSAIFIMGYFAYSSYKWNKLSDEEKHEIFRKANL